MEWVGALAAVALIVIVLNDAFEAILLPRRVTHDYLARISYRLGWVVWRAAGRLLPAGRRRHAFLSVFGPVSLLALLVVWATGLIVGFGLLYWSLGTVLSEARETEGH